MNNQLLHQLIDLVEEFQSDSTDDRDNLAAFAFWLAEKTSTRPRSYKDSGNVERAIAQQSPDVQISIMIGRMAKYARGYSKKILHDNQLSGLDDYSFLATLMFRPPMSKAELTHHNITETTSGADIIKRLIKSGFMEELECTSDKRAKLVGITALGRQTMLNAFQAMEPIAAIIPGDLKPDEKLYLLEYLKRLDKFHNAFYRNNKNQ